MPSRRWVNRHQPQTLVLATVLLYMEGLFNLARGAGLLLVGMGMAAAGFGIANNRRWGWWLGVTMAGLSVVARLTWFGYGSSMTFLLSLVFPVALFALLVHPHSRGHQRIWFE